MKKLFLAALVALGLGAPVQAQPFNQFVTGLPNATVINPSDTLYLLQGGVSKKVTGAVLAASGSIPTVGVGQTLANNTAGSAVPTPTNWMASGTSCPVGTLSPYQMFANATGAPTNVALTLYGNSQCVQWGTLNTSTNAYVPFSPSLPHLTTSVEGTGFPGLDGVSGGVNFFMWNAQVLGGPLDAAPTLRIDRNPSGTSTCSTPCGGVPALTVNASAPINDAWSEFGIAATLNNSSTVSLVAGFPNMVALIGFSNKLGAGNTVTPTWGTNTYCADFTGVTDPTTACIGIESDAGAAGNINGGTDIHVQRIANYMGITGAAGTHVSAGAMVAPATGVVVDRAYTIQNGGSSGSAKVGFDTSNVTVSSGALFMSNTQRIVFDGSYAVGVLNPTYTKSLYINGGVLVYETSSSGSGGATLMQITAGGTMNLANGINMACPAATVCAHATATNTGAPGSSFGVVQIDQTDNGGANSSSIFTTPLLVNSNIGSTAVGIKTGATFNLSVNGGTGNVSNGFNFYVATSSLALAQSADNSTITTPLGYLYGANPSAQLIAGGTNWRAVVGIDAIAGITTNGASAACASALNACSRRRIGIQLESQGNTRGTVTDAAVDIFGNTFAWGNGLVFDDTTDTTSGPVQGSFPVVSTGTLIRGGVFSTTLSGVANGVDFSMNTFSGSAFKSPNFSVGGSGVVTAASVVANQTSAPQVFVNPATGTAQINLAVGVTSYSFWNSTTTLTTLGSVSIPLLVNAGTTLQFQSNSVAIGDFGLVANKWTFGGSGGVVITNNLQTNITGSTQCVQASSSGVLSGTGAACGSGSGAVNSVTNVDGTLTITPTTGAVVASLALGHANTWTATQTMSGLVLSAITGSTQCLQVNTSGVVAGSGSGCGAPAVSAVSNSDGTLTISPTTGAVVASIALGHANVWTGAQTHTANTAMGANLTADALLTLNQNTSASASPGAGVALHLVGAAASVATIAFDTYAQTGLIRFRSAQGTIGTPTVLQAGNQMMNIQVAGYDGSAYSTGAASIQVFAASATTQWGTGDHATLVTFNTTPAGSTTLAEAMRLNASGGMSVGTAADPGAGVITVQTGFRIGNAATAANFLRGNGTNFVSAAIVVGDLPGGGTITINGTACTINSTCTVSASAGTITVGTTLVASGTTQQLLFDNAGTLAEVTKANNSVLVSNGTGVPSWATTLPSGLTAPSLTITTAFTATGLVTNSALANPSTTVNGVTCTLGSTCTISASAGTITVGVTTIASGTTQQLLFDNAGALGELAKGNNSVLISSGTGVPSWSTSLPSGLTAASFTVTTAFTATGLVTNADLVNSSHTINGVSCALGASCTVTAAAGTLTGTTLNSTVVTSSLTAVGTITTGVWNGTAIANANLANSATTVNGVSCVLGSTCTVALTSAGFANPSVSVGLSAVTGSALTALRSDSAPALSVAIAPVWSGQHIFTANTGHGANVTPDALVTIDANTGATTGSLLAGTIFHLVGAAATGARISTDTFQAISSVTFRRAEGTVGSPTGVASGAQIGNIAATGYGATVYSTSARASMQMIQGEAGVWTDTAQGAFIIFTTTPAGGVATAEALRILGSGSISVANASIDPGNGNIGFQSAFSLVANGTTVVDYGRTVGNQWTYTSTSTAVDGSLSYIYGGTAHLAKLLVQNTGTASNTSTFAVLRAALANESTQFVQLYIEGGTTPSGVFASSVPMVLNAGGNMTIQTSFSTIGQYWASGCWFIGTTPSDCGANNLQVQGLTILALTTDSAATTTRTVCQNVTGTGTANGLYFGSGTAGVCKGTSARYMKTDIAPVSFGLAEVLKTDVHTFKWRSGFGHDDDLTKPQFGFIADEVGAVMPQFTTKDANGVDASVDYMGTMMALYRSVQQIAETCNAPAAANDNFCLELKKKMGAK